MSGMVVTVQGVDQLLRRIDGAHLVQPAARRALDLASELAQRVARQEAPKDTSALARSIQRDVRPLQARVFTPVPYAAVMEFGRRPGVRMPPPAALRDWARRHGLGGLEFVIARAIARRGIRGRFYMKKAVDETRARLPNILRVASEEMVRRWRR